MGIWQRVIVSSVLTVVAMLPVAGLCCMLACAAPAHSAAALPSHCIDTPGEASIAVSAVVLCEAVTEANPADLARQPRLNGPDADPVAIVTPLPDAGHTAAASTMGVRRLSPRASPLLFVLRI